MRKAVALLSFICLAFAADALTLNEIRLRDPYILNDPHSHNYYLYCAVNESIPVEVLVYSSTDLENWQGPVSVMRLPWDNWAFGRLRAPEVHLYDDRYYMLVTVISNLEWRKSEPGWGRYVFEGTQIFVADTPDGPYEPVSVSPQTPLTSMAHDGTLFLERGVPFLVYATDWVQTECGVFRYCRLSRDLARPKGTAASMFSVNKVPWSCGQTHPGDLPVSYPADGPFMYRGAGRTLYMLWSTYSADGYAVGVARSESNGLRGPWIQQEQPLYSQDGGQPCLFRDNDGALRMVIHTPDSPEGGERARIFYIEEKDNTLILSK